MKLIHQYLFTSILLLIFTSALQSAPKAFDSLGNELEALQTDCKQYLKDPNISKKLKKECRRYNAKVTKAFKVGYPLDASVENDTASEKKLDLYLALLRETDESKESSIGLIESEIIRARKNNNIKYYSLLIDNDLIKLSSDNYEFMKQHDEEFQDNSKYKHAIWEEKRGAKEKRDLEKEKVIAQEEATQKKQRSTKYLSPSSQVSNYRPSSQVSNYRLSSFQGRGQQILEESNRRSNRFFERENQRAQRERAQGGSFNVNNIGQFRREQMEIRKSYRKYENW